jgi:hypothetical protein
MSKSHYTHTQEVERAYRCGKGEVLMAEARNEDERVAAFLDGRMTAAERTEMLRLLAADDDAYQHFVATAAILHKAKSADTDPPQPL